MSIIGTVRRACVAVCVAAASIVGLGGCADGSSPASTAAQMTLAELKTSAGYAWFPYESDGFTPDAAKIAEIGSVVSGEDKVYMFVNPSCSCKGTQKLFPRTVKVLLEAGLKESQIEIWSMRSTSDAHPYKERFSLQALPTIYFVRGGATRGQLTEFPEGEATLENAILTAIQ